MTKAVGFTQSSITRAINGARKAGLHIMGITAEGTVLVSNVPVDPNLFKLKGDAPSAYEHTEA